MGGGDLTLTAKPQNSPVVETAPELIYISTSNLMQHLTDNGYLFPYRPTQLVRARMKRRAFLTRSAVKELTGEQSALMILGGATAIAHIHNALTRWVTGGRVYRTADTHFLKDLDPPPPEIWEIRVTEPRPQFRVFGRFLERDTFIVTHFHSRSFLKEKGSAMWEQAMKECANEWVSLPCMPDPLSGNTIGDYVGENYDDFPIKKSSKR